MRSLRRPSPETDYHHLNEHTRTEPVPCSRPPSGRTPGFTSRIGGRHWGSITGPSKRGHRTRETEKKGRREVQTSRTFLLYGSRTLGFVRPIFGRTWTKVHLPPRSCTPTQPSSFHTSGPREDQGRLSRGHLSCTTSRGTYTNTLSRSVFPCLKPFDPSCCVNNWYETGAVFVDSKNSSHLTEVLDRCSSSRVSSCTFPTS